jgi:hypothetical protein
MGALRRADSDRDALVPRSIRLPFWASPWRRGWDAERGGYVVCTMATSRSDRNTDGKSLDVYVFDEEIAGLDPQERKNHIMISTFEALKVIGVIPAAPDTPQAAVMA